MSGWAQLHSRWAFCAVLISAGQRTCNRQLARVGAKTVLQPMGRCRGAEETPTHNAEETPTHTSPGGAAHELFVCPPRMRCSQDERGVSRDEMSAALVEVAEGRVPKDRIALK